MWMDFNDIFGGMFWLIPVVGIVGGIALVIVLIVTIGKVVNSRSEGINKNSFETLVADLRTDNEALKKELTQIKTSLASIEKMMKDVG